ncbi:hypothetical protein FANTH_14141 [Fusarium anthophilum]|uniref:F-box domain-containing protein n=1 Tax=Fusarium anthophilum TaxID=48485 RepID=A0A8H4YKK0_9HYPO|nr:hypothetical protein FANTH_14141 [Fusarium anthophilum]
MSSHPNLISNPATVDNLPISVTTRLKICRMGQLLDLPDELLTDICTLICDSDRLALFPVTYVNKRLHRIASPLLVRHWPFYREILYKQAPARFALHLVRNPHLQGNVKSIIIDDLICVEQDDPLDVAGLDELALVARQRFPELANDPGWCDGLVDGKLDSALALLLVLCTRVESLELTLPYYQQSRLLVLNLVSLTLRHSGPQRPLENLKLAMVGWHDAEDPGDIQCAAPFFHLPNVKTLVVSFLSDKIPIKSISEEKDQNEHARLGLDYDIYETRFPVGTSPVEELFLNYTSLTYQGLLTVFSACKRLTKLVFALHNPAYIIDRPHYSFTLVRQALLLHAASLEELGFDLEGHRFGPDVSLEYGSTMGLECLKRCFKQLNKLKRLTMDIHVIYYHDDPGNENMLDCLPRSLEHLGLLCNLACHRPQVLQLVEILCTVLKACGTGTRLCELKTLEIFLYVYGGGIDEDIYEPVNDLAREKGIKFSFIHKSHEGGGVWELMGMTPSPCPPIGETGPK